MSHPVSPICQKLILFFRFFGVRWDRLHGQSAPDDDRVAAVADAHAAGAPAGGAPAGGAPVGGAPVGGAHAIGDAARTGDAVTKRSSGGRTRTVNALRVNALKVDDNGAVILHPGIPAGSQAKRRTATLSLLTPHSSPHSHSSLMYIYI